MQQALPTDSLGRLRRRLLSPELSKLVYETWCIHHE